MEQRNRPSWMEDELVKNIDKRKLALIEELFVNGHGKNQKEMMSYLIPMMKKAKQENISFTSNEITAAINAIKKHSSKEELQNINNILEKHMNRNGSYDQNNR